MPDVKIRVSGNVDGAVRALERMKREMDGFRKRCSDMSRSLGTVLAPLESGAKLLGGTLAALAAGGLAASVKAARDLRSP